MSGATSVPSVEAPGVEFFNTILGVPHAASVAAISAITTIRRHRPVSLVGIGAPSFFTHSSRLARVAAHSHGSLSFRKRQGQPPPPAPPPLRRERGATWPTPDRCFAGEGNHYGPQEK